MKKIFLIIVVAIAMSSCSSFYRIGDLTMISNRNVDSQTNYVLIERDVEGLAEGVNNDALERATDDATSQYNGEFLKNVKVYIKDNGEWVKIVGDVWGVKDASRLVIGDYVLFKRNGKMIKGRIVGRKKKLAIVEYSYKNKTRNIEIDIIRLTKTSKD